MDTPYLPRKVECRSWRKKLLPSELSRAQSFIWKRSDGKLQRQIPWNLNMDKTLQPLFLPTYLHTDPTSTHSPPSPQHPTFPASHNRHLLHDPHISTPTSDFTFLTSSSRPSYLDTNIRFHIPYLIIITTLISRHQPQNFTFPTSSSSYRFTKRKQASFNPIIRLDHSHLGEYTQLWYPKKKNPWPLSRPRSREKEKKKKKKTEILPEIFPKHCSLKRPARNKKEYENHTLWPTPACLPACLENRATRQTPLFFHCLPHLTLPYLGR